MLKPVTNKSRYVQTATLKKQVSCNAHIKNLLQQ